MRWGKHQHLLVLFPITALMLIGCGSATPQPARPASEPTAHATDPTQSNPHANANANANANAGANGHEDAHPGTSSTLDPKADPIERALDEVTAIHGAAGPWAVAGYRMSEHALAKLGLRRGSFDLQIVHWTPKEVRYSCIADGAAAHSGASLGKLNLSLVETTADNVLTVYRDKKSGKSIALRPTAAFRDRYADTPQAKARALGREVLGLPADQVFEEIPIK